MAKDLKFIDHEDAMRELLKDPEFAKEYWRQSVYTETAHEIYRNRKRLKLEQSGLAKAADLTPHRMRAIESGEEYAMSLNAIQRVAQALGCRVSIKFKRVPNAR